MSATKEKILKRIDEVLEISKTILTTNHESFDQESLEKATLGALSLLRITYGENSKEIEFLTSLRHMFHRNGHVNNAYDLKVYIDSTLLNLKSDIEFDFIESIEKRAIGEVFGDLLSLSKGLIDGNHKEAAVVLACGALEDSLKKFAVQNGLDVYDADLSQVVNSLKSKGILRGPQAGVAQSYVSLRNKAFHAQFDKIEVPEVKSLIAFTEAFVIENFK
jgi:hypothetical protein